MPEEIYNIYDLLDMMREKPAMYLGVKSLIRLQAYIDGYNYAMNNCGLKDNSNPAFLRGIRFYDWIAERFGYYESTAGWCNIILADTLGWSPEHHKWSDLIQSIKPTDDATALDRFYELLDEYKANPAPLGPDLHERRWAEDE